MKRPRLLSSFALLLGSLLVACASSGDGTPGVPVDPAEAEIRATLERLYRAFGFDAGGHPDWDSQREIYLEGAAFVPPIQSRRAPVAYGTEPFLADFEAFVDDGEFTRSGLHERILGADIRVFGGVAQAFVGFEGYVPGEDTARTRGLDGLQFVRDGSAWKLVSFVTQYEGEGLELPASFRR